MKKYAVYILAVFVSLSACSSNEEGQKASQKKYEEVTLSVEEMEKKSPACTLRATLFQGTAHMQETT